MKYARVVDNRILEYIEQSEPIPDHKKDIFIPVVEVYPELLENERVLNSYSIDQEESRIVFYYDKELIPQEEINREAYIAAINAGFDTGLGYRLFLTKDDRNSFDALTTLLLNKINRGKATLDTYIQIKDMNNVWQPMKISEYFDLIDSYGDYFIYLKMTYQINEDFI